MLKKLRGSTLFYILLLVANIALVWLLPYFPTRDGPSHIYNIVILHDLLNGGNDWGKVYTYKLQAYPNLGFHLIAYPMLHFFPPLAVEKFFISLYILLMGVSVPFFLRTFSVKVFPFAYFLFPILFNYCLMMGFYSYVITVPIFFLALSMSWRIMDDSVPCRILCFNLMGFILFYFHLIPAVLYLTGLVLMYFVRGKFITAKITDVIKVIILVFPLISIIVYYVYSYLFLAKHSKLFLHIPRKDLLRDFITFSTTSFNPLQEKLGIILFLISLICFSTYLYGKVKDVYQKQQNFRDTSQGDKFLICFALLLILIYFIAPFNFGEGSFFNQRFPWVIFLVLLPLFRFPEQLLSIRSSSFVTAVIAVLFLASNATTLFCQNMVIEDFMSGMQVSVPKGSFIMLYKNEDIGWSRVDVLFHAVSYYGMEKKCVDIGNYEAGSEIFPVRFRNNLPDLPSQDQIAYDPMKIKLEKYPDINYLFAWKVNSASRIRLCKYFYVIWKDDYLSIWKRRPKDISKFNSII